MELKNGATSVVQVEVCLNVLSTAEFPQVKEAVTRLLSQQITLREGPLSLFFDDEFLSSNVDSIVLGEVNNQCATPTFRIFVYQLNEEGPVEEMTDGDAPACQQWLLPAREFNGLWESLVFEETIKSDLIDYVSTAMLFSDKLVDPHLINWNRVILLHGPPGTGKTSLCKALAQKLSIRLSDRYAHGQLIEINAHSLFSKWFSESGKLVEKLFRKIKELIDEEDTFVCVLIDEVESLTAARKSAMSGVEPSDAMRVVNAVLTQIDQLKMRKNVMILTTSNITGAIDLAFVDRADIKQYLGLPTVRASYQMLSSCLSELMRVGIISPRENFLSTKSLELLLQSPQQHQAPRLSVALCDIAVQAQSLGLSGRALRKLPILAHAFHIQAPSCSTEEFLNALKATISQQAESLKKLDIGIS